MANPEFAIGGGDYSGKCSTKKTAVQIRGPSKISKVETDGLSALLYYQDKNSQTHILRLDKHKQTAMLPIVVYIDNKKADITDLQGKKLRGLQVFKKKCHFSHPVIGEKDLSLQWIVQASLDF